MSLESERKKIQKQLEALEKERERIDEEEEKLQAEEGNLVVNYIRDKNLFRETRWTIRRGYKNGLQLTRAKSNESLRKVLMKHISTYGSLNIVLDEDYEDYLYLSRDGQLIELIGNEENISKFVKNNRLYITDNAIRRDIADTKRQITNLKKQLAELEEELEQEEEDRKAWYEK